MTENSVETSAMDPATAGFLKALASETLQKVMQQFTGGIELTVGEIAQRCALTPSTASEHLSLLHGGGLVVSRKEGKQVYYRGPTVPPWRSASPRSRRIWRAAARPTAPADLPAVGQERRSSMADMAATTDGATW
ncbi:metalloregulator ArsR/SmtB family transcription factor [Streptomyces sp. NBC_00378]|uniref:ArsR/SmtB family transcription factor n=1 Tax=unclassified Streptomyces TaxID=2593676 RepID=UPI0022510C94|nr:MULTISPECIES: metalloregulator ArsR/SmtB family transcription factor [unclassified Streptomyces]MCX5107139.1 metalloregulator ArsR/SmtB family transcription factor [Streptomyces sp. NBC_00378]